MAAVATSLLFAITLLLSGVGQSFSLEVRHVIKNTRADGFVVAEGQRGPWMSPRPFPASVAEDVARRPGVTHAEPFISIIQPDKYLIAHRIGNAEDPLGWTGAREPALGSTLTGDGEITVDQRTAKKVGDTVTLGGTSLKVTGVTKDQTVLGNQPIVVTTLKTAQNAVFGGYDVITSVAVKGEPRSLPKGYIFITADKSAEDFLKPLNAVTGTIKYLSILLWFVASAVVGSVVYISTIERIRDFAVFKAVGASTGALLVALALQSVLLSVLSSVVAIALTYTFAPTFPVPGVSFPATTVALLPIVAIGVGLIASAAGLRRAVKVDPAVAFGS